MMNNTTTDIALLPFFGKDVPHFVLEPNHKCNLSCTACYKHKENTTKSLEEIKQDIDLAMSKRNLDTISILGGEPTLHPDLPEVIKYISDKDITVRILSNGLTLTDDLLERYKRAGLDMMMLHIDSMQSRPDLPANPTQKEVNELRDKLFSMVARHGIRCGLVITLYKSTLDRFVDDFSYVISSKFVDQMLVTSYLAFSLKHVVEKYVPRNEQTEELHGWISAAENDREDLVVELEETEATVHQGLKLVPDTYICSSRDRNEKRWIFYLVHSIILEDGSFAFLPLNRRTLKYQVMLFQYLHKLIYGRRSFFGKFDPLRGKKTYLFIWALFSLDPVFFWKACSFIASSFKKGACFRGKSIFIQSGPRLSPEGELDYCNDCPDATIRNGRLLPVCLADVISPIHLKSYPPEVQEGYRKLLDHLNIKM